MREGEGSDPGVAKGVSMGENDEAPQARSPFERIGGVEGVERLVDAFYANMDRFAEARAIREMHAKNLAPIIATLKLYFIEWMGGPKDYSLSRGHPRLRMRHARFPIDVAARDAWLLCMAEALDATVAEEDLKIGLARAFANLADHMRNQPEVSG